MDFKYLIYEKKDNNVAYLTINRPEVMNSLHLPPTLGVLGSLL
jgi:1,4-dihydroxy-2-naphthoyl-CoA synthase